MDSILKSIVEFSQNITYKQLPQPIVQTIKKILIDTLGCAIGAFNCEESNLGKTIADHSDKRISGRILGEKDLMSLGDAAFVNTCMIRNHDFNDAYPGGHPSDMLGALFALAPVIRASGKKLIVAVSIAYEIFIRHMLAGNPNKHGFDQGGAVSMATAASVSYLLGLDAECTAHAVSIATVGNIQLRATRSGQLSMWKGCATAYAIRNTLFAVLLAKQGMTGPSEPFLGRDGLLDHFSKPFVWKAFGSEEKDFYINNVNLKYWPVAYQMQAAAWCGVEIFNKKINILDIKSIEVFTNSFAIFESGSEKEKWDPKTKATADHSLPYIMLWAILHGEITSLAFRSSSYLDPKIRPMLNKIFVKLDKEFDARFPKESCMRAIVIEKNGRKYVVEIINPIGHCMNPMSMDLIFTKFNRLALPIYGQQVECILNVWRTIDELDDVRIAFDLLVCG